MDAPAHERALLLMREHHQGVLNADGQIDRVKFIIDGATGALVLPSPPGIGDAEELVLFVPEEQPDMGPALQLLLTGRTLEPDSEPADRWRAYFGTPRQTKWLTCEIEGGKLEGEVIEPELLRVPNTLRAQEARLCKRLNADKAALASLCQRSVGVTVPDPLAVGVDPTGIDIRARFGVIHVLFPAPVLDPAAAALAVESLLGAGR